MATGAIAPSGARSAAVWRLLLRTVTLAGLILILRAREWTAAPLLALALFSPTPPALAASAVASLELALMGEFMLTPLHYPGAPGDILRLSVLGLSLAAITIYLVRRLDPAERARNLSATLVVAAALVAWSLLARLQFAPIVVASLGRPVLPGPFGPPALGFVAAAAALLAANGLRARRPAGVCAVAAALELLAVLGQFHGWYARDPLIANRPPALEVSRLRRKPRRFDAAIARMREITFRVSPRGTSFAFGYEAGPYGEKGWHSTGAASRAQDLNASDSRFRNTGARGEKRRHSTGAVRRAQEFRASDFRFVDETTAMLLRQEGANTELRLEDLQSGACLLSWSWPATAPGSLTVDGAGDRWLVESFERGRQVFVRVEGSVRDTDTRITELPFVAPEGWEPAFGFVTTAEGYAVAVAVERRSLARSGKMHAGLRWALRGPASSLPLLRPGRDYHSDLWLVDGFGTWHIARSATALGSLADGLAEKSMLIAAGDGAIGTLWRFEPAHGRWTALAATPGQDRIESCGSSRYLLWAAGRRDVAFVDLSKPARLVRLELDRPLLDIQGFESGFAALHRRTGTILELVIYDRL